MRVLLDENVPITFRRTLPEHDVATVRYLGWLGKDNGELLALADDAFDVMITGDTAIYHEQNLDKLRRLAVIVLVVPSSRRATVLDLAPQVLDALRTIRPRTLVEIRHPAIR